MSSITIRQLDDALKRRLRLRAARNGRSMEDEARTILRTASAGELPEQSGGNEAPRNLISPALPPTAPSFFLPQECQNRVLLIIGGGIAAYKSLDLIRRLKERGLGVRCILTRAALEFVTALSA